MKEVVLRIEDSAFEKIINFLQLCPMVEVVSASKLVETKDLLDKCFHEAVSELRKDKVFRRKGEYGYIMLALNDNVTKGFFFYSPIEYLDYLKELEFDRLPGKSSVYNTINNVSGHYPNWTFLDNPDNFERLRRNNIIVRFLSAFNRAKRQLLESILESKS